MKVLKNLLTMLLVVFPIYAHALGEAFTQDKFDSLNKSFRPAVVFIYADWCPTCKAQERILNTLLSSDEFKGISTLIVNFDNQKPIVNSFGAKYQSTLIVFKGGKEVARETGDTDHDRLAALLRKAL